MNVKNEHDSDDTQPLHRVVGVEGEDVLAGQMRPRAEPTKT
jgi:hypothetical protein